MIVQNAERGPAIDPRVNLLLISHPTPRTQREPFLEVWADAVNEMLGDADPVAHIVFAQPPENRRRFTRGVGYSFQRVFGRTITPVYEADDPEKVLTEARAILTTGGTPRILGEELSRTKLLEPLKARVAEGIVYIGTSAGAILAGHTVTHSSAIEPHETIHPRGLDTVPFYVNPHLAMTPDERSIRIAKLHRIRQEKNIPIVSLPDETILRVQNGQAVVHGKENALLIEPEQEPREIAPGQAISFTTIAA